MSARRLNHEESARGLFADWDWDWLVDAQNSSRIGALGCTLFLHRSTLTMSSRSRKGCVSGFRLSGLGR